MGPNLVNGQSKTYSIKCRGIDETGNPVLEEEVKAQVTLSKIDDMISCNVDECQHHYRDKECRVSGEICKYIGLGDN